MAAIWKASAPPRSVYFGKEPRKLSLAEAALLVALPQSPELRRPDRFPEARARRATACSTARRRPAWCRATKSRARKREPVPHERKPLPVLAPHAADQVVAAEPDRRIHRLTIDAGLQKTLQELARERAHALGPQISVAIIAVDNETGEVRARVGSADYFDERRAGQVDMTQALRSPGSTLKPFIYGLAFEDGLLHPETLIDDKPARYGSYTPENFDLTFQGTVTVRRALQMSLNVPAIAVLSKVGVSRLSARLTQTGAALVLPKGEAPGLAMGLGGVGIKLSDLVMLYTGLARQGAALPLRERESAIEPSARRLLDPVAAWYVGNILIGAPPPENAMPGAHRVQDRHVLRLSRCLGGRLRRPHDHRGLGRAAGRRAGAGPGTAAARRRRSCSMRSRAPALRRRRWRTRPRASFLPTTNKLPPPLQRFCPRRRHGRRVGAAAHHVPARRRAHRTGQGRGARSGRAQDFRRRRAAHRHGQWRAAAAARRAGARCSSSPTAPASCGSRSWMPAAPPTASASGCNNEGSNDRAGAWPYGPGRGAESRQKRPDEHGHQ